MNIHQKQRKIELNLLRIELFERKIGRLQSRGEPKEKINKLARKATKLSEQTQALLLEIKE